MLDSAEAAWDLILKTIPVASPTMVPLPEALGLTLGAPVLATGDSPPFDKALMDGYAIHASDYLAGTREFKKAGELTAGQTTDSPLLAGSALRIMTGAPLPPGADCVIPIEQVVSETPGTVTFDAPKVRPEGNLARKGQAIRTGDVILPAGVQPGPAGIGAFAEMGITSVSAIPRPTVAIVTTGDELVPYDCQPQGGQIRNSNEIMLASQIRQAGAVLISSTIARDNRPDLTAAIRNGLKADILILSGGVSAGVLDLVPSVLRECGCREIFHGCNIKPGKPIWFGEQSPEDASDGAAHWVFGLPGNPVSSMVCFELFVRTAIRKRLGMTPATPLLKSGRLAISHTSRDSRPTWFPAVLTDSSEGLLATPINWQGSFDLQTVARANGFVLFPSAGERQAGEQVDVLSPNQ